MNYLTLAILIIYICYKEWSKIKELVFWLYAPTISAIAAEERLYKYSEGTTSAKDAYQSLSRYLEKTAGPDAVQLGTWGGILMSEKELKAYNKRCEREIAKCFTPKKSTKPKRKAAKKKRAKK